MYDQDWREASLFEAAKDDHERIKRIASEYGFCVVRDVFELSALARWKDAMHELQQQIGPGIKAIDLMSIKSLRSMMLEPSVLSIARSLLGDDLVYYGESGINYESTIGDYTLKPLMQLHADATGTLESLNEFWNPTQDRAADLYPIYRFGVYFSDYASFSGGLKVVPGSHRKIHSALKSDPARKKMISIGPGASVAISERNFGFYNVPSRPGDVVIWNLHTLHSAGALRLKADPLMPLAPEVETDIWLKHEDLYLPPPGPRIAAFFDYGRDSLELDLYVKSRILHRAANGELFNCGRYAYDEKACREECEDQKVSLRYDPIIVSLGLQLSSILGPNGLGDKFVPDDMSATCKRLLRLCDMNQEQETRFLICNSRAKVAAANVSKASVKEVLRSIVAFALESKIMSIKHRQN